ERVFIVAFRSDITAEWSFPEATHFAESLAASKWQTGEYWERHQVPRKARSKPTPREIAMAGSFDLFSVKGLPWRTVRDALSGLRNPSEKGSSEWCNH